MLDNALILFTSDHGEMLSERRYRFNKYCLYESSVRVPLILSGSYLPAERRGRVDDRPAELKDVLPTLAEAAGAAEDGAADASGLCVGQRAVFQRPEPDGVKGSLVR
ncbi:sulfatase-like hydrolase/transferase [Paenibacillus sp. YN15]|uniref:sulfatase-like hydrolase/transferase n=1 Tax=Paenibacillus sp. YN15 TaxID=1742774 RepID=UPI00215C968D|nr:sulfatase-like hydrolase/transferase [Paenibacillus sp. YN15]